MEISLSLQSSNCNQVKLAQIRAKLTVVKLDAAILFGETQWNLLKQIYHVAAHFCIVANGW